MSGPRSVVDFVNRYAELAGRFCCSGKSWSALDRSLERYACEPQDEARADADVPVNGGVPADASELTTLRASGDHHEQEAAPAAENVKA